MKKKQPETNPDPQLRREALASDVEAFLKSGNTIEQIPSGVSAQANLRPANHRPAQPVKIEPKAEAKVEAKAETSTEAEAKPTTEQASADETKPAS